MESLRIHSGAPGLISLLGRATGIDASCHVRFRVLSDLLIDVYVTTPFDVLASRRIEGEVSRDGAVVSGSDLLNALQQGSENIGVAKDPNWPGALPPAGGFQEIDSLPVTVVRQLSDEGKNLARQFSGPLGPPASLLDQTVVTVENEKKTVEVPMRMIFTCTSLGLIPPFSAPIDVPRHLRVSVVGRWVRLDASYGTVYRSTGMGVLPV